MKKFTPPVPALGLPLRSWWFVAASLALFALTLTVGTLAKVYGSPGPDLAWDVDMIRERTTALTVLAMVVNNVLSPAGNVLILLLICLVLLVAFRKPLTALAFASTAAIGWFSSEIGKITVTRLRPPSLITHALIMETGHDSFPSGHTAFAASLVWAAVLVLANSRRQRIVTAIIGAFFVVAVALSRLYLGVHYPTDVLGSLLISTAGIVLWLPLWNRLIEPRLRHTALISKLTSLPQPHRTVNK
ncbi:phosphatase PAP2 family protein [Cryobacterium sp. 10C2]|uniref:phosphatase PAP2 family protein n=1 Tax=Cryobacterium sp. 10C2 TaxID=3048576 RepID=UPI002AB56A56|nr:phosphatase PAP2 family protein [Cryobacterium sp. 10C2]MDY7530037.1 phosphatase PAP2 family protein [Cryobacterium sp. 10C2]MEB0290592.1 phosphatase PAP2 family protein [Cryobacterium sp. 10C2]